jgi:hypothetical protein
VKQVTVDDVEARKRPAIAQVNIAVNGRSTDVKADITLIERREDFLLTGHAVVKRNGIDHLLGDKLGRKFTAFSARTLRCPFSLPSSALLYGWNAV